MSFTLSQRHSHSGYQPLNDPENQFLISLLQHDQLIAKNAKLERDMEVLRADKETYLSTLSSMQREKDRLWQEKMECQSELKKKDQLI
ncbi:hypothetical protein BLNAU_16763 [Blattamonas nauphoetae]|uniref:Uncharacterized protein n=1 Tax=Blattamonas nauphoetae TaxID=2049346 RepID=A0ABQ9XA89_9EUKA|nr:hypothetical protein BLNAU_16763 [Blattamonas nauphoetae]